MQKIEKLAQKDMNLLPQTPGVYLFFAKNKEIIYIGKAISIKTRVKNHFLQPTYKDNIFINQVTEIGYLKTNSEIEALLLEASLIKKHQPKFNQVWRDDKNYFYISITKPRAAARDLNANQKLPYVFITHQKNDLNATYLGPFVDGNSLKKTLKFLRKVFPYYTISQHSKQKCTWCHLDLCPGPNPNPKEYLKSIKQLQSVLEGKSQNVLRALKKEMKLASVKEEFEKAGKLRDQLFALEQIMAHRTVINTSTVATGDWEATQKTLQGIIGYHKTISRIECYDISNIQGKFATGSMVVFVDGKPAKQEYKKFKIQMKNEPNDIAMLSEVFKRRLVRTDWPMPQVMLIDGGIAQLNAALRAKHEAQNTNPQVADIKIISIAKGKRELLIENKPKLPLKDLPQEIYNLIVALDDQAHQFAITYHRKLRKKDLFKA